MASMKTSTIRNYTISLVHRFRGTLNIGICYTHRCIHIHLRGEDIYIYNVFGFIVYLKYKS